MKKTEYITIRTDPNIKAYLESIAEEQDRTLSWIVNKILIDYVCKQGRIFEANEEERIND